MRPELAGLVGKKERLAIWIPIHAQMTFTHYQIIPESSMNDTHMIMLNSVFDEKQDPECDRKTSLENPLQRASEHVKWTSGARDMISSLFVL